MHRIQAKHLLSGRNGMNLYRGCQHGCIYCDSRSACYQMHHPFEDIEVKENAPLLLEQALQSRRRPCMIGTGSMSDPYMPLEARLGLMRSCLEVIERHGFGISLLTKSDLVLRDLDILIRIQEKSKAVVQMTLTTADEDLCRILEPGVCTTARRVEVLHRMKQAGIPTVVWLCPILPWINDTQENIRSIVSFCAGAGVKGIIHFGMGLTLREGSREVFYQALDRNFPGLKRQYIRRYGNAYEILSPKADTLERIFREDCDRYGILHDNESLFRFLSQWEEKHTQMSLFD